MSAAPGDTATSSTRSPIRTTRNMPRGSNGSEATSIPTAQMLRHSLRPCTASQKSGTAAHCPVSGPDPGSSADGYAFTASQIGANHCVELLRRHHIQLRCREYPGIRTQDIDSAVAFDGNFGHAQGLIRIAN